MEIFEVPNKKRQLKLESGLTRKLWQTRPLCSPHAVSVQPFHVLTHSPSGWRHRAATVRSVRRPCSRAGSRQTTSGARRGSASGHCNCQHQQNDGVVLSLAGAEECRVLNSPVSHTSTCRVGTVVRAHLVTIVVISLVGVCLAVAVVHDALRGAVAPEVGGSPPASVAATGWMQLASHTCSCCVLNK